MVKGITYIEKALHDRIISLELFQKVQRVLFQRRHKKVFKHYYIFKGMLTCGYCGRILRSMYAKKKYHYYYCRDMNCQMTCVNELKVEEFISNHLKELAFTDNEVKEFKEALIKSRLMARQYTEEFIQGKKLF